MTRDEFVAICLQYFIDPALALENEEVRQAIKDNDYERLHQILREKF